MTREAWAVSQAQAWFIDHAPYGAELTTSRTRDGILFWVASGERKAARQCTLDQLRSGEVNAIDVVAHLTREVAP